MVESISDTLNSEKTEKRQIADHIEVNEPLELKSDKPVYFKAGQSSSAQFYFTTNDKSVIKVRVWSLEGESERNLYMNVGKQTCGEANCDWESTYERVNEINVSPEDSKYRAGMYRCLVRIPKG